MPQLAMDDNGDLARDIGRVHDVIRPHVRLTPVLRSAGGEIGRGQFPLTLKLEQLQHAGASRHAVHSPIC